MSLPLDHIIVAVGEQLDQAVDDYRALGFTVNIGGVHASGATHNALIWFEDKSFIELMALTGHDPKPGEADYSPLVRGRTGVTGYALRSDDIVMDVDTWRSRGVSVDDPVESGRLRPDGMRLRWSIATVSGGYTPFLVQYLEPAESVRAPRDVRVITHANGVTGLCHVDLRVGEVLLKAAQTPNFDAGKTHGVTYRFRPTC